MRQSNYLLVFLITIVAINVGYLFLSMIEPQHRVIDDSYRLFWWPVQRISLGLWTGLVVCFLSRNFGLRPGLTIVTILLAGSANMIGRIWGSPDYFRQLFTDLITFNAVFGVGVTLAVWLYWLTRKRNAK